VQITIYGQASGKSIFLKYDSEDLSMTLLEFLTKNGITIASSCNGQGVCKKCLIQNDWLTCELKLQEFMERRPDGKILISYL
jgi:ferredoxin